MSAEYQPVQIVDLKIHMLRSPDNGTPSGLLRQITDQGIEGWSHEVTADMAHALRWERYRWLPKGLRGVIDIGLWDIAGKRLGLPVWRLLGAARERVPAYRTQAGTFEPEGRTIDHFIRHALEVKAQAGEQAALAVADFEEFAAVVPG